MLDEEARDVIERFAAGDQSLRDEAIRVHRNDIDQHRVKHMRLPRGDAHFDFMSEIDTPMPDPILRSIYREKVIEARRRKMVSR